MAVPNIWHLNYLGKIRDYPKCQPMKSPPACAHWKNLWSGGVGGRGSHLPRAWERLLRTQQWRPQLARKDSNPWLGIHTSHTQLVSHHYRRLLAITLVYPLRLLEIFQPRSTLKVKSVHYKYLTESIRVQFRYQSSSREPKCGGWQDPNSTQRRHGLCSYLTLLDFESPTKMLPTPYGGFSNRLRVT